MGYRILDIREPDRTDITNQETDIMIFMNFNQIIRTVTVAAALCNSAIAFAQSSPASPAVKTIGATSVPKSEVVPSLIVLN